MRKYIFVIVVFISSIGIFSFNGLLKCYDDFKIENAIAMVKDGKRVEFNVENNYGEVLLKRIYTYNNLIIEKDNLNIGPYAGKAIYFTDCCYNVPIKSGRFFEKDDFQDMENKIVVGEKLRNIALYKNGKMYVKFNGIEYEVIGIMGEDNSSCYVDNKFYINLNGYLRQKNNISKEDFRINSISQDDIKLVNDICSEYSQVVVNKDNNIFVGDVIHKYKEWILKIILIIISLIISLVIVISNYINNRKMEVYIKKVCGAASKDIYITYIKDCIIICLMGFLTSFFIDLEIFKLFIPSQKVYLKSIFLTFFCILFLVIIIAYLFIRSIDNDEICVNIKENKNVSQ